MCFYQSEDAPISLLTCKLKATYHNALISTTSTPQMIASAHVTTRALPKERLAPTDRLGKPPRKRAPAFQVPRPAPSKILEKSAKRTHSADGAGTLTRRRGLGATRSAGMRKRAVAKQRCFCVMIKRGWN